MERSNVISKKSIPNRYAFARTGRCYQGFHGEGESFCEFTYGFWKIINFSMYSLCCRYPLLKTSLLKCDGSYFTTESIMNDQVEYLGNLGMPVINIRGENDPEIFQQVKNGTYILIYCSPECMLSTTTSREIFHDSCFREKLVGVAIDEAHCITQW